MESMTMSVKQAASVLGVTEQNIRCGIKQGVYPFGVALNSETGQRCRYTIITELFNKYIRGEM